MGWAVALSKVQRFQHLQDGWGTAAELKFVNIDIANLPVKGLILHVCLSDFYNQTKPYTVLNQLVNFCS